MSARPHSRNSVVYDASDVRAVGQGDLQATVRPRLSLRKVPIYEAINALYIILYTSWFVHLVNHHEVVDNILVCRASITRRGISLSVTYIEKNVSSLLISTFFRPTAIDSPIVNSINHHGHTWDDPLRHWKGRRLDTVLRERLNTTRPPC